MMNNRYVGALFLLPLLIILVLGGIYLKCTLLLLSIAGLYEFYKVNKEKGFHPIDAAGYLLCIVYYYILGYSIDFKILTFILIMSILLLLCLPVIYNKYNYLDVAITLLGLIYTSVFFSFIYLINIKPYGNNLVWLVFISSWACDTTAYYIGRNFGKRKLCPEVSPNKSVEGSIGGFVGSIVACLAAGYIFTLNGINYNMFNYILIGAFCGVFCQLGDLVASSIKRYCNVKDYSHLIPGHGGILDRFDSILFAAVVVYYYITIVMGI